MQFRHLGFRQVQILDDAFHALVVDFTAIGQRQTARGAREQPHSERGFKPADVLAGGGWRDAELACAGGDAAVFDGFDEAFYAAQSIHLSKQWQARFVSLTIKCRKRFPGYCRVSGFTKLRASRNTGVGNE